MTSLLSTIRSSIQKIFLLVLAGVTLQSCAKHKPHPLHPVNASKKQSPLHKVPVSVAARELGSGDIQYYFGQNLQKEGFHAVQLTIVNDTDKPYFLDGKHVEMNIENPLAVAKKMHFNTTARVLGWAVPAIVLWPLLIPAAIEGVQASNANKKIDDDLQSRAMDRRATLVAPPYSTTNRVLFVRHENLLHEFGLTLRNKSAAEALYFNLYI